MDTTVFDERIAESRRKLQATQGQMEQLRLQFIGAAKAWIVRWYNKAVEFEIQRNPELTKTLAAQGQLAILKKELNALCAKSAGLVEETLNRPDVWPLQQEWPPELQKDSNDTTARHRFKENAIEVINRTMRGLLSPVGVLLIRAGLVTIKDSSWDKQSSLTPTYKHSLEWTEGMNKTLKDYQDCCYGLQSAYHEIERAEAEKQKAQAKALWDQA